MFGWAKEILQKAVTVAIVAVGASISEGSPIEYRLLAMVAAYAVWTKVIVPRIENWFGEEMPTKTMTISKKSAYELI
jgi:hypothetical protein